MRKQTVTLRKLVMALIAAAALFVILPLAAPSETVYAATKVAKVTGVKVKVTNQTLTVTWKKASKAKTYQIYVKKGSGSFKKAATTSDLEYELTGCAWKTAYAVKVRGVNGSTKGAFSTVLKKTTPAKTTLARLKKSRADVREELADEKDNYEEDFADEVSGKFALSVSGNVVVMKYTCTSSSQQSGSGLKSLKATLKSYFNDPDFKEDVRDSIVDLEEMTGISGISFKVCVYLKNGTSIATYTYK